MFTSNTSPVETPSSPVFNEKHIEESPPSSPVHIANPVISSAEFVLEQTNVVKINNDAVKKAAQYILRKLSSESYTPRTWRTHPLHIFPPEPYDPDDIVTGACLNWIFLISSLNFSFWSEKEGQPDRYGVEWRTSWGSETTTVHTGYWSLVAALNRALEEGIPIIDPRFYSSETLCPDSLIAHIFRAAPQSTEPVPLFNERLAIMREVGTKLCNVSFSLYVCILVFIAAQEFGGSYLGFLDAFQRRHSNQGTALDLVQFVTDSFPSFRDEQLFNGRRVCFWKRPQILVAETWAAFYPENAHTPHPIFPGLSGPLISDLTMFADYRVPQILHHLRILTYPASLIRKLRNGTELGLGSKEEMSLRAASIIAVEQIRNEIISCESNWEASSVLIDFYLWDLAKKLERGEERIDGIDTDDIEPAHRTRSIWY
ncbi:uncharacterized protein EDB91DRAFT_306106 [Suillus paluster]|uniref:uncharacterized protein n=1 Tax=Suillus paluster TaxID=48578 RepID=UPI001B884B21|nr:uncharacterized protein EDB91DRAFT_306106 [Suillus paluster]KAG1742305.1 hypothetical protein EDB91DRAFT_306106 [Suillus paluster]